MHTHNTIAYARLALLTFMLYLMTSEIRDMCYLLEPRNMFSNKNCVVCIWSFKQIHFLYLLTCHRLNWCDFHFLASSFSKKLVVFFMIYMRTFERCSLKIWSSFLTMVFKYERPSLGIKSLNSLSQILEIKNSSPCFAFNYGELFNFVLSTRYLQWLFLDWVVNY